MKKILIASAAIMLISAALFAYSAASFKSESEKISYELTTLYGDALELDGVKINYKSELNSGMLWESNIEFDGGEIKADVHNKNSFFGREEYSGQRYFYLESDGDNILMSIASRYPESSAAKQYRLFEAGETGELELNLKDYFDYYPIDIIVKTPDSNATFGWETGSFIEMLDSELPDESERTLEGFRKMKLRESDYLIYKIYELYRIPIEKDYIIRLKSIKDKYNNVDLEFEQDLNMYAEYISGKDRDYFWLNIYDGNGTAAGSEAMQKIRGIYSIDIKDGEYDADSIKLIYGVGSGETIMSPDLSSDCSEFRAITEENGVFHVLILDAETGEVKQKERIALTDKESSEANIKLFSKNAVIGENDSDEFIGINISDERISVLVRDEEGRYERKIDALISPKFDIDAFRLFLTHTYSYSYKDGRLGIATDTYGNLYEGGTRYIGIYDNKGLRYFGAITCSLAEAAFANGSELELYDVRHSLG